MISFFFFFRNASGYQQKKREILLKRTNFSTFDLTSSHDFNLILPPLQNKKNLPTEVQPMPQRKQKNAEDHHKCSDFVTKVHKKKINCLVFPD